MEASVSQLIQQQFDLYQQESTSSSSNNSRNGSRRGDRLSAARARATSIQKQLTMLSLNYSMGDMSLSEEERKTMKQQQQQKQGINSSNHNPSSTVIIDTVVATRLVQYIDACMAMDPAAMMEDLEDDNWNSGGESVVDRVLDLVAAVAVVRGEATTNKVLERLLEFSSGVLERVRIRASDALGRIGYSLVWILRNGDDKSYQEEWAAESLYDVKEGLVPRLTEKSQAVRNSAIGATGNVLLGYGMPDTTRADGGGVKGVILQGTVDQQQEIVQDLLETLLWNLWHDPSPANRIAAIEAVPLHLQGEEDHSELASETVGHVLARIRDVKEKVRVQAVQTLQRKVDPLSGMTADQRCELIRSGLAGRCNATKEATTKLICCKWIKVTRFDPIELLKLLGVIEHEEECEKVVQVLLDVSSSPSDCPALAELSDPEIRAFRASMEKSLVQLVEPNQVCEAEALFLSRIACSYEPTMSSASRKQCDDWVGKVVPDIPILCEIFQGHAVRLIEAITAGDSEAEDVECFVCLQLLSLAKTAGLQEEGSRRHFAAVMKRLLASGDTPDDLVEGCVQALFASHDQEEGCLAVILEIISNIATASKSDSQRRAADEDEDEESANGDVDEERRALRILSILSIVLETVSPAVASNPLVEDFAQHIVPAVTHANSLVREAGVSCFGKLGLFTNSGTISAEFKPILLKVASNEQEKVEIRGQAVLALSDWAMLFPDILEPCAIHKTDDDVESEEVVSFGDLIQRLLGHSLPAVAAIAAEVAAKLLFAGRLSDSTLLAHLLLLFFDVNTENVDVIDNTGNNEEIKEVGSPVRLQQLLSLFFPAYCLKSELGRDVMVGSIGSLLELTNRKPPKKSKGKTKKAAAVPIVKILEYVCSVAEAGRATASNAAAEASKKTRGAVPLLTPREGATPSPEEEEQPVAGASPALLACLQVALYLGMEASNLTTTMVRALCKFLASHDGNDLVIDVEPYEDLVRLKEHMEELGMAITDGTSLKSLATMNELLADVESDDEGVGDENEGDETESENEAPDEDEAEDTEDEEPAPPPSKQQRHRTPTSVLDPTNCLVKSLTALSVQDGGGNNHTDKENVPSRTQRKSGKAPPTTTTTTRRRSSRASTRTSNASTVSILESLG